ncbi:MAG: hypothetical protein IJM88_06335 [Bacteroidales bacterium]|nr:hypothetical protein [Bacteroidales bacterium]
MKRPLIINQRTVAAGVVAVLLCCACANKDPHRRGVEAGKAACQCYQLEGLEAVSRCLDEIDKENTPYLYDTAYTNAMEAQLLNCITTGVIDAEKPIRDLVSEAPSAEEQPKEGEEAAQ